MKLGCITIIDSNGKTQVIAASLIKSECIDSFKWVLDSFEKIFSQPDVIFTDGDEKLATSIEEQWDSNKTIHLLCTWHVFKNVDKKLRCLFSHDKWKEVSNMWWRLCKESDKRTKDNFDKEWDEFVSFINKYSKGTPQTVSELIL